MTYGEETKAAPRNVSDSPHTHTDTYIGRQATTHTHTYLHIQAGHSTYTHTRASTRSLTYERRSAMSKFSSKMQMAAHRERERERRRPRERGRSQGKEREEKRERKDRVSVRGRARLDEPVCEREREGDSSRCCLAAFRFCADPNDLTDLCCRRGDLCCCPPF